MDKHNVVYSYSGMLFSLKKEGISNPCCSIDEPGGPHVMSKAATRGLCCLTPPPGSPGSSPITGARRGDGGGGEGLARGRHDESLGGRRAQQCERI